MLAPWALTTLSRSSYHGTPFIIAPAPACAEAARGSIVAAAIVASFIFIVCRVVGLVAQSYGFWASRPSLRPEKWPCRRWRACRVPFARLRRATVCIVLSSVAHVGCMSAIFASRAACATRWPTAACGAGHAALPNGPNCSVKRPVRGCQTGRFARPYGPAGGSVNIVYRRAAAAASLPAGWRAARGCLASVCGECFADGLKHLFKGKMKLKLLV